MSRFVNLEFAQEPEDHSYSPGEALKDESYYFRSAQTALEAGHFEKTLRDASKVLEYNPNNAQAWTLQVRMLIELGEFREAKLWSDKALEKFPHEAELLAAKGVALARLGDYVGAMAFSDASIEERGTTPYIWLARGDILLAQKERKADYCFEQALAIGKGAWMVAWLASRIRLFYKQVAKALALAQKAVAADSARAVAWFQLACCQREMGLVIEARAGFVHTQELDPTFPDVERCLMNLKPPGLFARLGAAWRGFNRSE